MKICSEILEALDPFQATKDEVFHSLEKLFASYATPVELQTVSVTASGTIFVSFIIESEDYDIVFGVDEEGKPYVITDIEDEEEYNEVDLDDVAPVIDFSGTAKMVDLTNSAWLSEQVLADIISGELDEAHTFVVRDGKKVKVKLVRKKRRRVQTAKVKAGIRKAVQKRRANKGQISRNRKKSNKLRKRMGLKGNKNKNLKVQGTSSAKR